VNKTQISRQGVQLTPETLNINGEEVSTTIENFIRHYVDKLYKDGVVLGLSGGLDSAVATYLCTRSVGSDKVLALYMPDKDSDPKHAEDVKKIVNNLGIRFQEKNITSQLYEMGIYDLLPTAHFPRQFQKCFIKSFRFVKEKIGGKNLYLESLRGSQSKFERCGNAYAKAKHRVRMTNLYYYAEIDNLLVVTCTTKTEWLIGHFSLYGIDHSGHIAPLRGLYKSQVKQLAIYLNVPSSIINKPPSPDLIPGIDNSERDIGMSYKNVDLILYALEKGMDCEEISKRLNLPLRDVRHIESLMHESRFMREVPYTLESF